MVKQLQKGKTAANVYDPVQPMKDATVEATLRHLKPHYQDMVKVQWFGKRATQVLLPFDEVGNCLPTGKPAIDRNGFQLQSANTTVDVIPYG